MTTDPRTEINTEYWWSPYGVDVFCFGDGIPYEFDGDQ